MTTAVGSTAPPRVNTRRARQTLGLPPQDGPDLQGQLNRQASGLTYDPAAEEAARNRAVDLAAEQEYQRLGRTFAIDPGGVSSGGSQRSFETLASNIVQQKAGISADVLSKQGAENRANVGVLQGVVGQSQQYGLQSREQREASAVRAAGLTGTYNGQQTQQAQAQAFQQQESQRQFLATLSQQERQFLTQATGQVYGGVSQLTAADLGVPLESLTTDEQYAQAQQQVAQAYYAATGQQLSGQDLATLMQGGTVAAQGAATLASRQLGLQASQQASAQQLEQQRIQIEQQRQNTADTLSAIQGAVSLAQQSGKLYATDPITGQAVDTQTLAAKAQQFEQTLAQLNQSLQQTQFLIQQTGQVSGAGQVTAATLGIDPTAFAAADPQTQERLYNQAIQAFTAATGRAPTTQEINSLLQGGSVQTGTQQTLASRQLGVQAGSVAAQNALAEANAALQRAEVFGQGYDPQTGDLIQTLQARVQQAQLALQQGAQEGVVIDPTTGQPTDRATLEAKAQSFQQALAIADQTGQLYVTHPETGDIVDRATLAQQAQSLQAEIQRGQMSLARAQNAQQAAQFYAQATGLIAGPMAAANLGVDTQGVTNPDGSINYARFNEVADQLGQVLPSLGMALTVDQQRRLALGESINVPANLTLGAQAQIFQQNIQTRQQSLAETNAALSRAIEQGNATGQFIDPETGQDYQTLQAEVQRGQLALANDQQQLARQQEAARVREAEAGLTGQLAGRTVSLESLGLTTDNILDPATGQVVPGGQDAFFALADVISQNFQAATGRPATAEELNAIFNGQGVTLDPQETLQKQLQDTQLALQRAQLFGQGEDPESGATLSTLQQQELDLRAELERNAQRLQQAELFGGQEGFSVASLGLDLDLIQRGMNGQLQTAAEQQQFNDSVSAVVGAAQERLGRNLYQGEVDALLRGEAIGARQTEAASQFDAQQQLAREQLAGQITGPDGQLVDSVQLQALKQELTQQTQAEGLQRELASGLITLNGMQVDSLEAQQFNETVRQFDESLLQRVTEYAAQYGLDANQSAAAVRQINQSIINDTRALSAQIGQQWAALTGRSGTGSENMSALDFGVDVSALDQALPIFALRDTPEGQSLQASFEGLMGRPPTDQEFDSLLSGSEVSIDGVPTLEARQVAATITAQNMERIAKYDQIATENQLNRDQFEQAKTEADRAWAQANLDVASEMGLDPNQFRTTKFILDAKLARAREASLQPGGAPYNPDQIIQTIAQDYYGQDIGAFLRANDRFDQLYGNQLSEIGRQRGFEDANWLRANEQADRQEQQMLDVWGSLYSGAGGLEADFDMAKNYPDFYQELNAAFNGPPFGSRPAGEIAQDPFGEELRQRTEQTLGVRFNDQMWVNFIENFRQGDNGKFKSFIYDPNWFGTLSDDEQQGIFAIINGGNISPERQQASTAGGIEQILGQLAGQLITLPFLA